MHDRQQYRQFYDSELDGMIIGGYRVGKELGHGGFGRVFKATRESDGLTGALKILNPALTSINEITVRFRREASLAARLKHPNIAEIYDFGAWEDTFYFVMAYIEGRTLWDIISEDKGLSVERTLSIIGQANEALACADALGIVHRDVKPGNIIVCPDDRAYLLDFGLAKEIAATAITRIGSYLGTLEYMSPEQLRAEPADIRSDMYSLGLTFWQCLTGTVPYGTRDIGKLLESRKTNLAHSLHSLRPDAPPRVKTVLERMLEYHPSSRYVSPRDLARDLERVQAGHDPFPLRPQTGDSMPVAISPKELESIRSGTILQESLGTVGDSDKIPPTVRYQGDDLSPNGEG